MRVLLTVGGIAYGGCCKDKPFVHSPAPGHACSDLLTWCSKSPHEPTDLSQVICIDGTGDRPVRYPTADDPSGTSTILAANRALDIRVVYEEATYTEVGLKLGGNLGHTTPLTGGGPGDTGGAKAENATLFKASGDSPKEAGCKVVEGRFAARTPGPVILTLSMKKTVSGGPTTEKTGVVVETEVTTPAGGAAVTKVTTTETSTVSSPSPKAATYDLEFSVPKIYSGALRVGIGGVVHATNHGFEARKRIGSSTSEIVDLGQARMDPEVILGYALFPQALMRSDGRDYVYKWKPLAWRKRWGFYTGIGVIGAPGTGTQYKAEFFRSFHLGFEYELAENVSIATTAVFRRRDELKEGLHVGDPVDDGTALFTTRYKFGFGFIVNFSLDFFRFTTTVVK